MRKRTVKLWRLHEDGRKLFAAAAERGHLLCHLSRQLRGAGAGTREQRYSGCLTVRNRPACS
jgi:hypothetical protein